MKPSKSSWSRFTTILFLLTVALALSLVASWIWFLSFSNFLHHDFQFRVYSEGKQGFSLPLVSASGIFSKKAVSTDAKECAKIGGDILRKNGSAVDSAIATLFCMGLVIPESNGIGGGSIWTIKDKKGVTVIDAREVAPGYVTHDMYFAAKGDRKNPVHGIDSIAVPSEVAGSWEAHKRFGRLSWKELLEPSIELARNGFFVGEHFSTAIRQKWHLLHQYPDLKRLFVKKDVNGNEVQLEEGDIIKRPDLAKTFEIIGNEGINSLYHENGTLLKLMIQDLKRIGSQMTVEDMTGYRVRVYEEVRPRVVNDGKYKVYSSPVPSSGNLMALILDIVFKVFGDQIRASNGTFIPSDSELNRVLVEAWKFGYAKRSLLGDLPFEDDETLQAINLMHNPGFASKIASIIKRMSRTESSNIDAAFFYTPLLSNEMHHPFKSYKVDSGTSGLTVVDDDEATKMFVSVGATVNAYFGSFVISPSTGIILNNEMDDFVTCNETANEFGVEPSHHNRVEAGKRPVSSICPTIITDDKDNFLMALAASGGTHITSSVSLTAMRYLLQNKSLLEAIDEPRIHHQLFPMKVGHEKTFSQHLIKDLQDFGHEPKVIEGRGSIVMGIARHRNHTHIITEIHGDNKSQQHLIAVSDKRKGGDVDGL